MMHNYYAAEMDHECLILREMRSWWDHVQERDSREFEDLVCAELQKLDWNCASRKTFSEILGRGLRENPGDIDVLAWRSDGRIVVVDCKNLQFSRRRAKWRSSFPSSGEPLIGMASRICWRSTLTEWSLRENTLPAFGTIPEFRRALLRVPWYFREKCQWCMQGSRSSTKHAF